MVDLDPVLEAPFETAANRWFRSVLAAGIALLGVVAAFGRSRVTMTMVALYLLALLGYLLYRLRIREGTDATTDDYSDS